MLCSKCAKFVRDDAHFCMECGQPVGATPPAAATRTEKSRRPKPRIAIWGFVLVVLAGLGWVASNYHGSVKDLREKFLASPHMETISDKTFSINPRTFTSNKFTVPKGASDVVVTGPFSVSGGPGNEIEVYVLSDDAFVIWRNGYATSNFYDSGKVSQGTIHATLPGDVGAYYLVFSNNVSPKTSKKVQADVTFQYSRWAPDWFYSMKDAF